MDPESYSIVKDPVASAGPACRGPAGSEEPLDRPSKELEREEMVELIGIEPTTSGLQSPRSPS
jgi:hypothetical protein